MPGMRCSEGSMPWNCPQVGRVSVVRVSDIKILGPFEPMDIDLDDPKVQAILDEVLKPMPENVHSVEVDGVLHLIVDNMRS